MKTRIISGAVMAVLVASVVFLGLSVSNLFITVFLCLVAAVGVYELVSNAAGIKHFVPQILSAVYTGAIVYYMSNWSLGLFRIYSSYTEEIELNEEMVFDAPVIVITLSVVYFIASAIFILIKHSDFDLSKIAVLCAMPLMYAFAFSTLGSIIVADRGIYYLLLILNFACVCDMGAYFVGVFFGKTKLCPEISPKKTVEGALGGIASSVLVSLIITACFGYWDKLLWVLLLTVPLCAAGMAGDLFASVIKRKVGIKDYGSLIPGHGGVLDRVDSILFISPLVYCLVLLGIL